MVRYFSLIGQGINLRAFDLVLGNLISEDSNIVRGQPDVYIYLRVRLGSQV